MDCHQETVGNLWKLAGWFQFMFDPGELKNSSVTSNFLDMSGHPYFQNNEDFRPESPYTSSVQRVLRVDPVHPVTNHACNGHPQELQRSVPQGPNPARETMLKFWLLTKTNLFSYSIWYMNILSRRIQWKLADVETKDWSFKTFEACAYGRLQKANTHLLPESPVDVMCHLHAGIIEVFHKAQTTRNNQKQPETSTMKALDG